jgi:molybdopterin molybdotransferase
MSAEFRRASPYPMLPIDEAQRVIAAQLTPLPVETISSLHADGRVLAADVYAHESLPDVRKAAVDGYALRAGDALIERRVLHELTAGSASGGRIESGTAARVMTGAPLPPGADSVVMVEQTEEHAGMLRLHTVPRPGQHIRQVGEDITQDELLLARGSTLGAAEVGLLAMLGITQIDVYQRPRVAVLATGDEVVEPNAPREQGGVRDSNRYALLAAVRAAGCEAISLGIARDDAAVQRAAILRGLEQADVLLTSGGVSMGTRDLIKPLLAELGTLHFGRVHFKPGKPTTFATVQGKLAFGLPGFPASSLVSFEVFVRPTLRRLQGDSQPERPRLPVVLAAPVQPAHDRPDYQRVVLAWRAGQLVAHSTGSQLSSRLLSLRDANGLLIVPPGEQPLPAGHILEALLTGQLRVEE